MIKVLGVTRGCLCTCHWAKEAQNHQREYDMAAPSGLYIRHGRKITLGLFKQCVFGDKVRHCERLRSKYQVEVRTGVRHIGEGETCDRGSKTEGRKKQG